MFLTSPNIPVPYATLITIDTVSLNDVLGILLSFIISKISSAFFLVLFAVSLLIFSLLSYMRTSILLASFSKTKFVSSVTSVN